MPAIVIRLWGRYSTVGYLDTLVQDAFHEPPIKLKATWALLSDGHPIQIWLGFLDCDPLEWRIRFNQGTAKRHCDIDLRGITQDPSNHDFSLFWLQEILK